jgi:hypothetical protein
MGSFKQGGRMKKDIKAWAIKIRNRSFYTQEGQVRLFHTRADANYAAEKVTFATSIRAEPIRVKIRIEETT